MRWRRAGPGGLEEITDKQQFYGGHARKSPASGTFLVFRPGRAAVGV
jgi:hypothetical protein